MMGLQKRTSRVRRPEETLLIAANLITGMFNLAPTSHSAQLSDPCSSASGRNNMLSYSKSNPQRASLAGSRFMMPVADVTVETHSQLLIKCHGSLSDLGYISMLARIMFKQAFEPIARQWRGESFSHNIGYD